MSITRARPSNRRWNDTTVNCVVADQFRYDHYKGSLTNLTELSNSSTVYYNVPAGNYDKWGCWVGTTCSGTGVGLCEFPSSYFECRSGRPAHQFHTPADCSVLQTERAAA
jgi:hypothetical protein